MTAILPNDGVPDFSALGLSIVTSRSCTWPQPWADGQAPGNARRQHAPVLVVREELSHGLARQSMLAAGLHVMAVGGPGVGLICEHAGACIGGFQYSLPRFG